MSSNIEIQVLNSNVFLTKVKKEFKWSDSKKIPIIWQRIMCFYIVDICTMWHRLDFGHEYCDLYIFFSSNFSYTSLEGFKHNTKVGVWGACFVVAVAMVVWDVQNQVRWMVLRLVLGHLAYTREDFEGTKEYMDYTFHDVVLLVIIPQVEFSDLE